MSGKAPGKRIPFAEAKRIAEAYGQQQVVMVTTDGETTHVVTYGATVEQSRSAAQSGNNLKRFLGWPEEKCQDVPARVRRQLCRKAPTRESQT